MIITPTQVPDLSTQTGPSSRWLVWLVTIAAVMTATTFAGFGRSGVSRAQATAPMKYPLSRSCPPSGKPNVCTGLCQPGYETGSKPELATDRGKYGWCETDPAYHKLTWISRKEYVGSHYLVSQYGFAEAVNEVYLDFSGGSISGSPDAKLILAVYHDRNIGTLLRADVELKESSYYREWSGATAIPGLRVAVKFTRPVKKCSVVLAGIDRSKADSVAIRLNGLRVSIRPSAPMLVRKRPPKK